jgi:hypothetical protein
MVAGVGEVARCNLGVDGGGLRAPPAKPRAPAWASIFDDPFGMVDSTWAAASFTWWLGFRLLRFKIHRRTGTINRAFCTES